MFFHNFKYALRTLFKNKMLIFWTFAFPILLGTFFNMAFADIENNEKLDVIDIAIVNDENSQNYDIYKSSFKVLSDKNSKQQLFNTKYVSKNKAKKLLAAKEIIGYLVIEDMPKIVVTSNGIDQTVFKYVTDEISQRTIIVNKVISEKLEKTAISNMEINDFSKKIYNDVISSFQGKVNIKDISNANLNYTMIEFYTLIAMACLYGGILGMVGVNQNLANMSSTGKRIAVSPVSKGKLIFSSVLASYLTQLIGVFLLFIYTVFVLNVDYGKHLGLVVLHASVGSLAGLSLGVVVACLFRVNDNTKTGIVISITMLGCFLSGMMGITMKYIIDKNIPIINKLNPASMITDGFYSLYYYNTFDRFYFNVVSLLIFAFVMIFISILSLRRQKYDSI